MAKDLETEILDFPDYYALLGVSMDVASQALDKAFWAKAPRLRGLAKESKAAEREFLTLLEGYRLLSDSFQRKTYDTWRGLSAEQREAVREEFAFFQRTDRHVRDFERREDVRAYEHALDMVDKINFYVGSSDTQGVQMQRDALPPSEDLESVVTFLSSLKELTLMRERLQKEAIVLQETLQDPVHYKGKMDIFHTGLQFYLLKENERKREKHFIPTMYVAASGLVLTTVALFSGGLGVADYAP